MHILQERFNVRELEFVGMNNLGVFRLTKDMVTLCRGLLWCDVILSWFGKLHAFFAVLFSRLLGKPAIVVAGGEDVTRCYATGGPYGLYTHPLKKWFAHFAFRYADFVITVSQKVYDEAISNAKLSPSKTRLIYHGFDSETFKKRPHVSKERIVATIGNINRENWRLKGWDLFMGAARLLPEMRFYLIGPAWEESLEFWRKKVPENVALTGGLYGDDLIKLLSRVSVYVQASLYESFCCALADAMLCECVPVVSKRSALPEVVGDCGVYLDQLTSTELAEGIQKALCRPNMGQFARKRIIENFSLEQRRDKLLQIIESVAQRHGIRNDS